MSEELKEIGKVRITTESNAVVEAVARVTGRDKNEILREIIEKWAVEQIHIATVFDGLLRAEGMGGIEAGIRGRRREDAGTSGKGRA